MRPRPHKHAGGQGGAIGAHMAYVALVNSTLTGTGSRDAAAPSVASSAAALAASAGTGTGSGAGGSAAAIAAGRAEYKKIIMGAYMGGCVYAQTGSLLIAGSAFSDCNARFAGGALSTLAVQTRLVDSSFERSYADMVRAPGVAGAACRVLGVVGVPSAQQQGGATVSCGCLQSTLALQAWLCVSVAGAAWRAVHAARCP